MDFFDPMSRPMWNVIGVAILCGSVVGLERQVRGKPCGVRTSILVCLGTAIFVLLGTSIVSERSDATRVLGQVVSGVGFLGAGVMFSNQGVVSGVTTAAVIWLLSAIGAAVGFGHFQGAIALAIVAVTILVGVEFLESSFKWLTRGAHKRDDD